MWSRFKCKKKSYFQKVFFLWSFSVKSFIYFNCLWLLLNVICQRQGVAKLQQNMHFKLLCKKKAYFKVCFLSFSVKSSSIFNCLLLLCFCLIMGTNNLSMNIIQCYLSKIGYCKKCSKICILSCHWSFWFLQSPDICHFLTAYAFVWQTVFIQFSCCCFFH